MAASATKKVPAKPRRQEAGGKSDLEQLEEVLRRTRGKESEFYDQGKALEAIRARRLYRQTHGTFEHYCSNKWDLSRGTAYQLIAAARVVDNLRDCTPERIVPANEAQARPLTRLSADDQCEAWAVVVRTAPGGKITAAHVQAVVDEFLGQDEGSKPKRTRRQNKPEEPAEDTTLSGRLRTVGRGVDDFYHEVLGAMGICGTLDPAVHRQRLQAALRELASERVRMGWPTNQCRIDAEALAIELTIGDTPRQGRPGPRVDFSLSWGFHQSPADKATPSGNGTGPARSVAEARAAVKKWFRQASKRHHPDKGGDVELMKELNAVYEQLQKVLGKE
jgi:hypothetical protein